MGTSVIFLPTAGHFIGAELLCHHVSVSPTLLDLVNQLPVFFRKNTSVCRCMLGVYVGGGEVRVFLPAILDPSSVRFSTTHLYILIRNQIVGLFIVF